MCDYMLVMMMNDGPNEQHKSWQQSGRFKLQEEHGGPILNGG